ncbi:ABD12 lipase, partial [Ceuthmochares aereus]|nr:ABD12 lipase [Ceuthmochares aereus]
GFPSQACSHLTPLSGVQVDGVVLESAYRNIREAARNNYMARLFYYFPGFEFILSDSLNLSNLFFSTDENLKIMSCPLLLLHAEDDDVLSVHEGRKVFEIARNTYKDKTKVKLIIFPKKLGLGHDYISYNSELPSLVR